MGLKYFLLYSFLISSVMLSLCIETVITKIAYNKPLLLKEKCYNKTVKKNLSIGMQTTESSLILLPKEDESNTMKIPSPYQKQLAQITGDSESLEAISKEDTTTEANTTSTPRGDTSCICGIFLGSQVVKRSSMPPKGEPIIATTLERSFMCDSFGEKQCQRTCLEKIVRHLPNSANILCASLDRDIRKEKAFLFVRNCNTKWHNTNLTAGREYCCKNGLPYSCPKK